MFLEAFGFKKNIYFFFLLKKYRPILNVLFMQLLLP